MQVVDHGVDYAQIIQKDYLMDYTGHGVDYTRIIQQEKDYLRSWCGLCADYATEEGLLQFNGDYAETHT